MQNRESALKNWLNQLYPHRGAELTKLAGDASFRRYFRISAEDESFIAMDAPPEKEPLMPFIQINALLRAHQIFTPKIINANMQGGFLLLEDLGDKLFLDQVQDEKAEELYHQALDLLVKIQKINHFEMKLPRFSEQFMLEQMNLFEYWFVTQFIQKSLSDREKQIMRDCFNWIASQVSKQPYVFMHADFHSRNLMLSGTQDSVKLAVIDFQDAMLGPVTYDLVSILKDCYILWPEEQREKWLRYFYKHPQMTHYQNYSDFKFDFELTGVQRHIKVLGIFARLSIRDKKSAYIQDMPIAMNYLLNAIEPIEQLSSFYQLLVDAILPKFKEK